MEPKRQSLAGDPTPVTQATITITYNGTNWTFSPDEVWMAYNKPNDPADQVTFNLTDSSGSGYKISGLSFTDVDGNSIPSVMADWSVPTYAAAVSSKTIADHNRNTGTSNMQINYCVTIMKENGTTRKSDPKIWDVKGSG